MDLKTERLLKWMEGKKMPPVRIEIHPTDRCNLKCRFCWQNTVIKRDYNKTDYNKTDYNKELPEKKILSIVDRIRMMKKIDVIFLDYLQVVKFETNHPGRPDLDLANISERLQAYCKINKIVGITALQLKASSTKDIRKKSQKISDSGTGGLEVNTEDLSGSQKIIADADNALSAILNADNPPTKMFVFLTKGRDNEARSITTLDFDGKTGRISDPDNIPGQVRIINNTMYDDSISNDTILNDEDLFSPGSKNNISEKEEKNKTEMKKEIKEIKEDKKDDIMEDIKSIDNDKKDDIEDLLKI